MSKPTRVGVVGCGLIAQVMHLPYLTELGDRFELRGLCDCPRRWRSGAVSASGGQAFTPVGRTCSPSDLDAVMVLTSGDHAPIAIAAAQAGLHVFVEKPMALSSAECAA